MKWVLEVPIYNSPICRTLLFAMLTTKSAKLKQFVKDFYLEIFKKGF
jgi:hypothetical protein